MTKFEKLLKSFSNNIHDLENQFKLILEGSELVSNKRDIRLKLEKYSKVEEYISSKNNKEEKDLSEIIKNMPEEILLIFKEVIKLYFDIASIPIFLTKQK
ncbi:MAG: hypothetical protein HeimC3_26400, partial [Candidatus Heimdallarchaeota archaeon LC_3]